MAFRDKKAHAKVRPSPRLIGPVAEPLVGSSSSPLEFGGFLLSSAGLHLLLAWAVVTLGFHSASLSERPLVVRLVEAEAPKPSPTGPPPAQSRAPQQSASRPSAQSDAANEITPRELGRPSVALPEEVPSRLTEMFNAAEVDERRRAVSPPAAEDLVKDRGTPSGGVPPSELRTAGAQGLGGPKVVGAPGGITLSSGAFAGSVAGPAMVGGAGAGESGSVLSSNRGGSRRLGAELAAPLAPTVTVGARQAALRRDGGGGSRGAAGGKFARPAHGENPLPKYPPLAREKGFEGTVYLRVLVERDGRVSTLAIDRSSGYKILDKAAADSVKEWTFLPAHTDGKPVTSWVLLPVRFMLK